MKSTLSYFNFDALTDGKTVLDYFSEFKIVVTIRCIYLELKWKICQLLNRVLSMVSVVRIIR